MTALAVQAAVAAPTSGPAPVAAKSDTEDGFSALLKQLHDPKSATKPAKDEAAAVKDGSEPPASSVLQSLEAALANLAALSTPALKAEEPKPEPTAAPLDATLSAAANALEATGWDASGKTPLKALLESDPSLGLTDFQIKTFLAAAGATPAKTGATPLGADTAWSPLEAAKAALAAASPQTGDAGALSDAALPAANLAANLARTAASNGKPHSPGESNPGGPRGHGVATLAVDAHGAADGATPVAAAANANASSHRGGGDAGNSGAPPAAVVQAASVDAALPAPTSVPFASLPNFIADQAAALTSEANAASSAAATEPAPKAAQAVKELHIVLDPADLGEMTLKLRLTGGKLSVTISVANASTLSAIEDDRNLIAARLASGDQSLDSLAILRQNPSAASQQEPNASHGFANEGFSQSGSSDKRASDSGERPKPPPRGGAGGAFSDFIV